MKKINSHVKKMTNTCSKLNVRDAQKYDVTIRDRIRDQLLESNEEEIEKIIDRTIDEKFFSTDSKNRTHQIREIARHYANNGEYIDTQNNFIVLLALLGSICMMIYGVFDYVNDYNDFIDNCVYALIMFCVWLVFSQTARIKKIKNESLKKIIISINSVSTDFLIIMNIIYYGLIAIGKYKNCRIVWIFMTGCILILIATILYLSISISGVFRKKEC